MKPYMNEEELIDELVDNKRINKDTIPEGIFSERAYTSLVTPYKRLLCINYNTMLHQYIYKENGDFSEYINLANIDEFISNKFSVYIESFEKYFKTYVGEVLASKIKSTSVYCNDYSEFRTFSQNIPTQDFIKDNNLERILSRGCHYQLLDMLYFDQMYDVNLNIIQADKNIMLNRRRALNNILSLDKSYGNSSNPLIQHHFNKREVPPIWAVIHTLALGDILAIYNMFPRRDREGITKNLLNLDFARPIQIGRLSAKINLIRKIRNNINHYEPLIPTLMKSVDRNTTDSILEIIKLLKTFYQKQTIQSVKVIRKTKYSKCDSNDFNKNYIRFINEILTEFQEKRPT